MVDFKEQNARASKLLKELSLNIEPDTEVGKLSVSKQQMVEIAKALYKRRYYNHGRAELGADRARDAGAFQNNK